MSTENRERQSREEVTREHLLCFLKANGSAALSYATLQEGLEHFVHPRGYVAFNEIWHPFFAPRKRAIAFSDPVCDPSDYAAVIDSFLEYHPRSSFAVVSEKVSDILRPRGFKVNCIGYEAELDIPNYDTKGNWKELDLIRRARNEVKRKGLTIAETVPGDLDPKDFEEIDRCWLAQKKITDREIWLYARRPVFSAEEGVRKFVAYSPDGRVAGYVFYDPIFQNGTAIGYAANIARSDERLYNKVITAIHMAAIDVFKEEGAKILNLCLAPFVKLDLGKYNDDWLTEQFLRFCARYGETLYNFQGLSSHKAKYRPAEVPMYLASNNRFPNNDIYLAFRVADIAEGYFSTLGKLLKGYITAKVGRQRRLR